MTALSTPAAALLPAVTLPDALALLNASALLHRAPDERRLRAAAAETTRDLLPGSSVRCDLAPRPVREHAGRHELVRSTPGRPALVLTVLRHPDEVTARDVGVVELLMASLASAWEMVAARGGAEPARPAPPLPLTRRELEVLALVARGATNAQAGSRLGIGARTVEKHLEHIAGKLGARGRTAASALYLGALAPAR